MKTNYVLLILSLVLSVMATAEPRRVVLTDGTEIIGELVALENGAYTIKSKSLGTLTVSDRQVASISSMGAPSGAGAVTNSVASPVVNPVVNPVESAKQSFAGQQMQSIQQSLMHNSDMMQSIMVLQSNPDMQAVLADPEIMAAIQRLDFEALSKNPKIQKLMQSSDIKSITGSVN